MSKIGWYLPLKRLADFIIALLLLALFLPVMIITAVVIKLSSPGPILFQQHRIKSGLRPFQILKFRTMLYTEHPEDFPQITSANDNRITPTGKVLRKLKLDEFPQLINVLKGDMSFVGPRPNVSKFVATYEGKELDVFQVPQGITDFASLWFREQDALIANKGSGNSEADYLEFVNPDKKRLQLVYIREIGPITDIKIFIATIFSVFFKISPMWCFPKGARDPIIKH